MINCLCCGKPLGKNLSPDELQTGWHNKCVRNFFGTRFLPDISITNNVIEELAEKSTQRGYTVPGVQKKLSLHLSAGSASEKPRLTLVDFPSGYILKPQTMEYPALPEAEHFVMSMARLSGIKTVPFALLNDGGNNEPAYITKRIDRKLGLKDNAVQMFAMEDFCQLAGRMTSDKYKGSYESCAKIVSEYSSRAGLDMTELYLRVVFSFAVGNSDMHLKNFSLIETSPKSRVYVLSEAYDMLPVNLVIPADTEQLALTLNGKKNNIHRKDFTEFARVCGIPPHAADNLVASIVNRYSQYTALCRNSLLPEQMKNDFEKLISERIKILAE